MPLRKYSFSWKSASVIELRDFVKIESSSLHTHPDLITKESRCLQPFYKYCSVSDLRNLLHPMGLEDTIWVRYSSTKGADLADETRQKTLI